jgi:tRNA U34 2-thiouridine synthase MnmA/TrmU
VCRESCRKQYLTSHQCTLTKFNWISGISIHQNVQVRFRHRQKLIKATYKIINQHVILTYTPTLAIAPGQFAVLYYKNICLGGGVVVKTL